MALNLIARRGKPIDRVRQFVKVWKNRVGNEGRDHLRFAISQTEVGELRVSDLEALIQTWDTALEMGKQVIGEGPSLFPPLQGINPGQSIIDFQKIADAFAALSVYLLEHEVLHQGESVAMKCGDAAQAVESLANSVRMPLPPFCRRV
jgi:hypothetical protein